MTPLRKSFQVNDKNGVSVELKLELADFSFAQRELNIAMTPFGETPFWKSIDEDPMYGNVVLLYVATRRTIKPRATLDDLVERFPTELLLGPVAEQLNGALEDFSQRFVAGTGSREALPAPAPVNGTYGPAPSLTSA